MKSEQGTNSPIIQLVQIDFPKTTIHFEVDVEGRGKVKANDIYCDTIPIDGWAVVVPVGSDGKALLYIHEILESRIDKKLETMQLEGEVKWMEENKKGIAELKIADKEIDAVNEEHRLKLQKLTVARNAKFRALRTTAQGRVRKLEVHRYGFHDDSYRTDWNGIEITNMNNVTLLSLAELP